MFTNGYEQNARIAKITSALKNWQYQCRRKMLDTINIGDNLEVDFFQIFVSFCRLGWSNSGQTQNGQPLAHYCIDKLFFIIENIMILPPIMSGS